MIKNKRTINHCRLILISGLILGVLPSLFAGGKGDQYPAESVSGDSYWTHTVDLEELEEGKYNLMIRALDEAGNIRIEGPYDFHVDPETDIPSVAVAHPKSGDRVGRILPIIGTARDDDSIARVEVSINEGSWRPASGAEAWSAVLDAGSLGDGPHYMSVRSVDVNGIESPVTIVPFIVDTSAPVGGITEPASGVVLAGKTTFAGVFEDPNGIETLELSRNGGDVWENVKFSKNKDLGSADFSIDLDSRDMEDGPVVWWLRAVDGQGSLSSVPFLFFVDNLGPEVVLKLPFAGEDGRAPVPGNVFLAGTVSDLSGVVSLTVGIGKQSPVEVPLEPGNPWWTLPLDLTSVKDKKAQIIISATDGAGNVSLLESEIPLDTDADRPVLSLDEFSTENLENVSMEAEDDDFPMVFQKGEAYLTGVFADDDGPGALVWSTGETEGRIEVECSWRLELPDLPVGEIEVTVTPEDRNGILGDSVTAVFKVAPPAPLITLNTVVDASKEEESPWTPGLVVSSAGAVVRGTVVSEAGRDLTLYYTSGGSEKIELPLKSDGENSTRRTFQFTLKKGYEPGPFNFILKAVDGFGGESVLGSGLYVEAEPDEEGNIPNPRRNDEAVNLPLPFLRDSDGAALLRSGQPLQGWTSGASAVGARIVPENPFVRLQCAGTSFYIEPVAPGLSEPFNVILADGSSSPSIIVLTDHEAPSWNIDTPLPGAWTTGSLAVSGTVRDDAGIASMFWALKGGPPTAVDISENDGESYSFTFEADLTKHPEGSAVLVLSAVDVSGNSSEYELPVTIDTTAPRIEQYISPSNGHVGARSTLIYSVLGEDMPVEVSITVDGENRTVAEKASMYALNLNLAGYESLPETLSVRAIDRAGNITEQVPVFQYDPVSDKPVTTIQTPVADSVVRGPTDLAGLVVDDDAIEAVYWRLNGGEWRKLVGGFSFTEPLPLDSLEDGSHYIEAYAVDTAGNIGEIDGAWFSVTRQEPDVVLLAPEVGTTNQGVTEISGTASDANGIAEVWVSFDNGHTYSLADGATDFEAIGRDDDSGVGEAVESEGESEATVEDAAKTDDSADAEATVEKPLLMPIIRDRSVEWRYALDTGVLDDGIHTLLIKVIDGAGDEALLAGLMESDNEPPLLAVGDPLEGSLQTGSMILEGRVRDEGGLRSFRAVIERDGEVLLSHEEVHEGIFHIPFEFSGFEAGEVLLRVETEDVAGNLSAVSRSFNIEPGRRNVEAVITLPVEGGEEGPRFTLTGFVPEARNDDSVTLYIDGNDAGLLELDERGRFSREFSPGDLSDGRHEFRTDVTVIDGESSTGIIRTFSYTSLGPWIIIDGFPPGAAVEERPLLSGRSGYQADSPPNEEDKDELKAYKQALKENKPERVEVSIDGGLTFEKAKGTEEWEFLIETGEMGEGDLPVLVRALFPEGWTYTRTLLRLDKTLPDLKLNQSIEDGRFNGEIVLTGSAADDRNLEDVDITVRPGGHGRYEVPSFIQGMYIDATFLGATWFTTGIGATFFDENVKLAFSYGWSPELVKVNGHLEEARVSGNAIGATILANIVYLPLGYYWGPKWEALSFSLAIGANFTYFSNFGDEQGGVMSSVVVQAEIPKIEFLNRNFFTYLAPYAEGKLWFFSSDVDTKPYFSFSIGLRAGLL